MINKWSYFILVGVLSFFSETSVLLVSTTWANTDQGPVVVSLEDLNDKRITPQMNRNDNIVFCLAYKDHPNCKTKNKTKTIIIKPPQMDEKISTYLDELVKADDTSRPLILARLSDDSELRESIVSEIKKSLEQEKEKSNVSISINYDAVLPLSKEKTAIIELPAPLKGVLEEGDLLFTLLTHNDIEVRSAVIKLLDEQDLLNRSLFSQFRETKLKEGLSLPKSSLELTLEELNPVSSDANKTLLTYLFDNKTKDQTSHIGLGILKQFSKKGYDQLKECLGNEDTHHSCSTYNPNQISNTNTLSINSPLIQTYLHNDVKMFKAYGQIFGIPTLDSKTTLRIEAGEKVANLSFDDVKKSVDQKSFDWDQESIKALSEEFSSEALKMLQNLTQQNFQKLKAGQVQTDVNNSPLCKAKFISGEKKISWDSELGMALIHNDTALIKDYLSAHSYDLSSVEEISLPGQKRSVEIVKILALNNFKIKNGSAWQSGFPNRPKNPCVSVNDVVKKAIDQIQDFSQGSFSLNQCMIYNVNKSEEKNAIWSTLDELPILENLVTDFIKIAINGAKTDDKVVRGYVETGIIKPYLCAITSEFQKNSMLGEKSTLSGIYSENEGVISDEILKSIDKQRDDFIQYRGLWPDSTQQRPQVQAQ